MLKLPPPVWALIYLCAATGVSWLLGWPSFPGSHLVVLGVVLFLSGWAPPIWAASLFQREGAELNPTSETNTKLVMTGPYAFTRNPMYLGLTIVSLSVAFWTGWTPMFVVPPLVFATANFIHIPFEEAKMRRQFGQAFDDYMHRVRRWL